MFDGEGKCDICIEMLCGQARKATMALCQRFQAYEFTPRRLIRMVTFWAGLDNPAWTKLSSKVYRLQSESGRVSWSTHVHDALIRYDSEDAW